jgi:ferritin-like protein
MIVAVKTNSKKKSLIRIISFVAVILMFVAYFFYMSNEFTTNQKQTVEKKIELIKKNAKLEKSKKLERIIYREIETAVDLIDQRNIIKVKIISNKALIVVDPDTNLDALKVRYGSMALIKKDIKDTKIAIDLKYIIESKYNEK